MIDNRPDAVYLPPPSHGSYTLLEKDFEQEILNPNIEILNKSKIKMSKYRGNNRIVLNL